MLCVKPWFNDIFVFLIAMHLKNLNIHKNYGNRTENVILTSLSVHNTNENQVNTLKETELLYDYLNSHFISICNVT